MIPLEDSFADIVGKAQRGLRLTDAQIAEQSGADAAKFAALKEGTFDEATLRSVAPVLGIGPDQVVALAKGEYYPAVTPPADGLASYNTAFEDMTVNAYLAWDPASKEAVVFDTGADASPILKAVAQHGLTVKLILLTHSHGDHIADLARLKSETGAPAWIGKGESAAAETFDAGKTFRVGALSIESRSTRGHCVGGITYVVTGLEKPVAVVGDAVFAGSMGGGGVSFQDALRTNKESIYTLPEETIICPGHGPLTSVAEELANNPFAPSA